MHARIGRVHTWCLNDFHRWCFVKPLSLIALLCTAALPIPAEAQPARVPVISIAAPEARSTELFSVNTAARGLSNGNVIVVDAATATRRTVLLDASMARVKVIMDSAAMNIGIAGIIPFASDTSAYVEQSSQSMLVLDPNGKVARIMAPPKAQDLFLLSGFSGYGAPIIDPQGRLIYRSNYRRVPQPNAQGQMMMPTPPETAPIIRGSFDARTVDTIGEVGLAMPAKMTPAPIGTPQNQIKAEVNPMATGDEWAALSDGSVAIVRWQDYHIDWINPDGTKRSTPKMPFDWRKVSDAEKQFKVDSMSRWIDSMMKIEMSRPLPAGVQRAAGVPDFKFIPLDEMPAYHPPIRPGSLKADRDNHLWILPTTSAEAKAGLLYDVVNTQGELFTRVQLPPGAVIAGFAKGGVVYLLLPSSEKTFVLARSVVKLPQ